MEEELYKKIDNLILLLDNDPRIKEINSLKDKLLSNGDLINNINKLKELDKYSDEYKALKKELFLNKDFVRFKELESEIDFLILEINNKLNTLTNERRCKNESN